MVELTDFAETPWLIFVRARAVARICVGFACRVVRASRTRVSTLHFGELLNRTWSSPRLSCFVFPPIQELTASTNN